MRLGRVLLVMIAIAGVPSAMRAQPRNGATLREQSTMTADADAVVDTLREMFAAAKTDDMAKFRSLITPGFYAFDNGKRFDGDALMRFVIEIHSKGGKAVWSVTEPDVHVYGDHAWIAYTNVGSLQLDPASPPVPTRWLESAFLTREDGAWKLEFLQSTRVPPPQPKP